MYDLTHTMFTLKRFRVEWGEGEQMMYSTIVVLEYKVYWRKVFISMGSNRKDGE